jgi:Flp pilus assembly pilin Flp
MSQLAFIQELVTRLELASIRAKTSLAAALDRSRAGERGQTTTEYVMIMGLIAAIIVSVFTVILWPVVSESMRELADKVRGAISGNGIT